MPKIWIAIVAAGVIVVGAVVVWLAIGPDETPRPVEEVERPAVEAPEGASAADVEVRPGDRILGDEAAPVTIVEYASLTCPHCADFHVDILPALKERYIEPGHVRLIYRDFPLDQLALRAAGLARCVEGRAYWGMLDILFESQERWARSAEPIEALARLGRVAGLDDDEIGRCLNDEEVLDDVVNERLHGEQRFQINSTPTFVIEGRIYRGAMSVDQFAEVLDPLVP